MLSRCPIDVPLERGFTKHRCDPGIASAIGSYDATLDNAFDGLYQEFWPNGVLATDGNHYHGQLVGTWTFRDSTGIVLETRSHMDSSLVKEMMKFDGVRKRH
jgi:hypothetical protein